ncbi:hypothetical protein P9112_003724 [Eukaryota sp. TZLM1-RC]
MRLYLNIPINQLLSKEKCICSNSPQLTLRHALNCSKLITYRSSLHDAVRDTVFNMAQTARISCYLWPCNLPNDLFCKCGAGLTLSHLFNCNRYISYRSTLHDAVRDQIHAMCNSYHIESFVEPLLRSLDINENVRDSEYGKRRADVVVPSGCMQEKCLEKCSIRSIPLDDSELYKRKKYANPLKELKHVRHVDYQICPFAISLYGRLGKTALNFIDDFENLVKKRMNKRFDRRLWLNRIVFTIFKSIPKMISKALMSVSAHYENIAATVVLKINITFQRISCIKEPLLKETLSLNNFGSDDRGDVYCYWIDNSEAIVDFVSCNVANDTLVHRRKLNPVAALDFKAKEKHRKYDKEIEDANVDRNTQLVFIAFPFSINGRLSVEAETFLDDFQKMVKEKTMK